jgi:uncharacterized membrane protein
MLLLMSCCVVDKCTTLIFSIQIFWAVLTWFKTRGDMILFYQPTFSPLCGVSQCWSLRQGACHTYIICFWVYGFMCNRITTIYAAPYGTSTKSVRFALHDDKNRILNTIYNYLIIRQLCLLLLIVARLRDWSCYYCLD